MVFRKTAKSIRHRGVAALKVPWRHPAHCQTVGVVVEAVGPAAQLLLVALVAGLVKQLAMISVTPGETLTVYVGGGGSAGTPHNTAGGGGGGGAYLAFTEAQRHW